MSLDDTKKINAAFILEIVGRPAEHLTETLNDIIKKISEEKGIIIKETKINEPILIKDQKDFYSSFAEIEIDAENILYLVILMFKYMPAHIEIISPQDIHLRNTDWDDVLNELIRRLHGYEELARILQTEKMILENKLREAINPIQKKEEINKEIKKKSKKKKENKEE